MKIQHLGVEISNTLTFINIADFGVSSSNTMSFFLPAIYRVIQEEKSIFWESILWVMVGNKFT